MSSFRVVIPFVWVYNGKRLKVKQKLWQDCPNFWPLLYMLQNFLLVGFFNHNFAILITQQPATTNRSGWGGWWRGGWCCWWGGASRSIQWDKFVNFIYFTIPTIILVLYTYGAAFKGCVTLCAYRGKSLDVFILCPNTYQSCGQVVKCPPCNRETGVRFPVESDQRLLKVVPDASLLGTQHEGLDWGKFPATY